MALPQVTCCISYFHTHYLPVIISHTPASLPGLPGWSVCVRTTTAAAYLRHTDTAHRVDALLRFATVYALAERHTILFPARVARGLPHFATGACTCALCARGGVRCARTCNTARLPSPPSTFCTTPRRVPPVFLLRAPGAPCCRAPPLRTSAARTARYAFDMWRVTARVRGLPPAHARYYLPTLHTCRSALLPRPHTHPHTRTPLTWQWCVGDAIVVVCGILACSSFDG